MSQDHLESLSQDILGQVRLGSGLSECIILSNVPLQISEASIVAIDLTNTEQELAKFADFIHKTTWCLVAIIHLGVYANFPIGNVKALLERNVHSYAFFIGNSSTIDLSKWEKPAVIIEKTGRSGYHTHVYCGRMESSYWRFNENYWQAGKNFLYPFGLRGESCLPLLYKQPFNVGYHGLLPNIFVHQSDGSVSGTDAEAIRLLADKYQMKLEFHLGVVGNVATSDTNATHFLAQIFRGELQGAIPGLLAYQNNKFFDLSNYLLFSQLRYVTRVPRKTVSFGNVIKGFDLFSWIGVFIALTCFSITFQTMFYVYKFELMDKTMYNNPGNPADFFLLTFSTFVEPYKINWFPSWSAGKMLALLWSLFALLMVSFYMSNLRTNLIAPGLEPEINKHEDILKYGKFVHADKIFVFLRQHEISPAFDKVLNGVDEKGGWYSSIQENGILEPLVEEAVLNNGDVYLSNNENVLYSYLFQKTLGFPNLRISNDGLYNFYTTLRIKKYSPYTPDINQLFTMYLEVGLFQKILNNPIPIIALPSTSIASQYASSENLRMSMEMLWTPIILLTTGSLVGGIIFIFEIAVVSRLQPKFKANN